MMLSNLVGAEPEDCTIGEKLEVTLDTSDPAWTLPKWRRVGGA